MIKPLLAAAVAVLFGTSMSVAQQNSEPQAKPMWVYVGTAGGTNAKGIYVSKWDAAAGRLAAPDLAAEVKRPSYVWPHPNNKVLLAVDQVEQDGKPAGMVRSYAIESGTGRLVELNAQPSGGAGPCYVSTDREGRYALAANYTGGSVAVLPIRSDGKLDPASAVVTLEGKGPNPKRQDHSYGHCFDFDPAQRFAIACDLGADKVRVYQVDIEHGRLTAMEPGSVAPGAGPRHVAFSHDGKFAYVVNEMGCTVTAFSFDAATGALTQLQTLSTLPSDHNQSDKDTGAEIFVHPSGKFLYASNRGHDSIVCYDIDPTTGKLSDPKWTPSGGKIPRYFTFDPTGNYMLVANQGTGTVLTFKLNPADGTLTPTDNSIEVAAATCLKFVPAQ